MFFFLQDNLQIKVSRILSIKFVCLALVALTFSSASNSFAEESGFEELPFKKKVFDLPEVFGKKEKAPEPKFTASFDKRDAKVGDTVTLSLKLELPKNAYTYSLNKTSAVVSKIELENVDGLEAIGDDFQADKKPKSIKDPNLDANVEKHFGTVTWTHQFKVIESDSSHQVKGTLKTQVCDDSTCMLKDFPFSMSLGDSIKSKKVAEKADKAIFFYSVVPERAFGKTKSKDPLEFTFSVSPEKPKAGDIVTLSIHAKLEGKWHIFDTTQNPEMYGLPTQVKGWKAANLVAIESAISSDEEPEIKQPLPDDEPEVIQHYFHEKATWTRKFRWEPQTAEAEGFGLSGVLEYQICDRSCLGLNKVEFALGSIIPTEELQVDSEAESKLSSEPVVVEAEVEQDIRKKGLLPFIIAAAAAGFLALLTPCVFPMVPITVSVFLKKSEQQHHRPIYMASVYALGMIGGFTGLGLLMAIVFEATALNEFANNLYFNLFLAGMLIFFGMNLLGMFELQIPSWMLTWSSKKESKGGISGILFMALTFTLVSFTCTFSFVGLLLVWAANGEYFWPIIGMLAFSTAFASPFFFLALFPSYLQSLPKSGGWMNTVKVTMGLVEIGAALKFLSVADPAQTIFDYTLVMSTWMMIAFVAGAYLLGLFSLPHDTPVKSISVPRFAFSMMFFGLAGYLAVGLFGANEPTSVVWQQIKSFAPPLYEKQHVEGNASSVVSVDVKDLGPYQVHDNLAYALDIDKAIEKAKGSDQPLFLDFTGVNCSNCRIMENTVLKRPENRSLLEKFVRAQLYVDTKYIKGISEPERSVQIYERNKKLQTEWLKDVTMPAYVVATPDGSRILSVFKGLETQSMKGQFNEFLKSGLKKFEEKKTAAKGEKSVMR